MSQSQFEKRKQKTQEEVIKEITKKRDDIRETALAEPTYTQTALDVYTSDGRKYHVAEIVYDPESGVAKVLEVFDITRLVALQYFNTKTALGTLKRKAKKNGQV